jgi:CHAT domain-containing protein
MPCTRTLAAGVALSMVVCLAAAQTPAPATARDVDALLTEAGKLLEARKTAEGRAAYERALEGAQRLALEAQQAAALCGISQAFYNGAQYRDARQFALRCLELYERLSQASGIGQANILLNAAAEMSGDMTEARTRARLAISAFESAGDLRGRAIATLNVLRAGKIEPADGDRLIERAIDDARAAGARPVEASAFHSWGDGLFARGQYEASLEKLERAAGLYEELGNRVALGTVFNSIGRVYRAHGQVNEALRFQLKALDIHQAAGEPFSLMQSLNAVGAVQGMLGNANEARRYYERALVIAEQSSSLRIQDFLRANIAGILNDQGDFTRSVPILEEVIAHGVDSYPSLRQRQLSYARVKLGRPREGLDAAEKAVALCGDDVTDCIWALHTRATARAALGDQQEALADVTAALNRIEDVRKRLVPTDFFKQEFHRMMEAVYSQAIAISLSQNQERRALEQAELARSRAFLDLLATRVTSSSASAAPASANDIAASAKRVGSTFVVYWVAYDGLFAWVVTPDGAVQARRVHLMRARLDELVRATSPPAESGSAAGPTRAWRELYDLLIQPIRDVLPRAPGSLITVVPHGPLLNLSFAALQDPRGRYLLEDYTIHYTPAASMLQFTSARQHPAGPARDMLFVADPVLPIRSRLDRPLPRLPGARAEVQAIARLVPPARVTVLQDSLATEAGVRAALGGKVVLHFATHAVVRDDDPMGSFLALGPAGAAADGDGVLTAQEVYGWRLNADLIVLSACRSGGGRVTGDGVAAFVRAFVYAGTSSVVASLWDVADEPTNRLLPGFYRSWLGGQSKALALRTAQLQLLRDLRAGKVQLQTAAGLVTLPEHPALWAGFALIGEPK